MEDHILTQATKAKSLRYRPEDCQDLEFYVPEGFACFDGSNPNYREQSIATEMSYYFPLPNLAKIASRIRFNRDKKQIPCRPTYHWSIGNNSFITIVEFDDYAIWVLKLDIPFKIRLICDDKSHISSGSKDGHTLSPNSSDTNSKGEESSQPKGDEGSDKVKKHQPQAKDGREENLNHKSSESSVYDIELETDSKEVNVGFSKLNKEVEDSRRFKIPEIPMMVYHGIVRLKSIEAEIFTAMVAMDYIEGFTADTLTNGCRHFIDELELHEQQKLEDGQKISKDKFSEIKPTTAEDEYSSANQTCLRRGYCNYIIDSQGNKIPKRVTVKIAKYAQWRIWYEFAKIKLLFAAKFDLDSLRESDDDLDLYNQIVSPERGSYFGSNSRWSESKRCERYEHHLNRDMEEYRMVRIDTTYGEKLFSLLRWAVATWKERVKNEGRCFLTSFSLKGANMICNKSAEIVSVIDSDKLFYATLGEWAQPPRMIGLDWYSSECLKCFEEFKDASTRKFVFKELTRKAGKDYGISPAVVERLVCAFDSIEAAVEAGTCEFGELSETRSRRFLYSEGFMDHVIQMLATRDVIPSADASKDEIVDRAVAESHDFFKEQELLEAKKRPSSSCSSNLGSLIDELQVNDKP